MVIDLFAKYKWQQKKDKQFLLRMFPDFRIKLDETEYKLLVKLLAFKQLSIPVIERVVEEAVEMMEPKKMSEELEFLLIKMDQHEIVKIQELDDIYSESSERAMRIVKKALISVYEYSRNGYYAVLRF